MRGEGGYTVILGVFEGKCKNLVVFLLVSSLFAKGCPQFLDEVGHLNDKNHSKTLGILHKKYVYCECLYLEFLRKHIFKCCFAMSSHDVIKNS